MPSPARKEGLANEDASGEEIFEDSESPVFSVNLEKAAFTAKRCNLPSSHGMETGPLGMLPWGHAAPNARDGDADLISISLINFSPLPWARFRADNRRFPTHVRETLFALSHRLQLTSCPPPPPRHPVWSHEAMRLGSSSLKLVLVFFETRKNPSNSGPVIPDRTREIKRKVNDKNSDGGARLGESRVNVLPRTFNSRVGFFSFFQIFPHSVPSAISSRVKRSRARLSRRI